MRAGRPYKPALPRRANTLPDVHATPRPAPLQRAKTSAVIETAEPPAASADLPSAAEVHEHSLEVRSRRRRSSQLIDTAMITSSDDPQKLEIALRMGLDAGLPDHVLMPGVLKLVEHEHEQKAAAEAKVLRRLKAAAEAAAAANEAAEKSRKTPREGDLVRIDGLTKGKSLVGGEVNLAVHNGRVGRVVEPTLSARYLVQTAYDEMPACPSSRRLVCVHTGTRCTDADQRHGVWLAVPLRCVNREAPM